MVFKMTTNKKSDAKQIARTFLFIINICIIVQVIEY